MDQWLLQVQPRFDEAWESAVPVDGTRDGTTHVGQRVTVALADPDCPVPWCYAAGPRFWDDQVRSTENVLGAFGDPRQVKALIADLRALIRMCDKLR